MVFYFTRFVPTTCFGPYGPSSGGIYTDKYFNKLENGIHQLSLTEFLPNLEQTASQPASMHAAQF
jgi:hypothetical protein